MKSLFLFFLLLTGTAVGESNEFAAVHGKNVFTYPGGLKKAVIISMDDALETDRRFVSTLNAHNLKGTFHLCGSFLGTKADWIVKKWNIDLSYIRPDEIKTLYSGHEVSCHSFRHMRLRFASTNDAYADIHDNLVMLEPLAGYPVAGIAYPFGGSTGETVAIAKSLGLRYGRVARCSGSFALPEEIFHWKPTCWVDDWVLTAARYKDYSSPGLSLLLAGGHSYEFALPDKSWDTLEQFCTLVAAPEIWSVTMRDFTDYLLALQTAASTVQGGFGRNPAMLTIWISNPDGGAEPVAPGERFALP